jgi:ABC-type glycerol-3-phosphate transport system substrate-binding protein
LLVIRMTDMGEKEDFKINYEPLYLKVKEVITRRILDGTYTASTAIPSESILAKEFGMSISTIRQALSILVFEGTLDKKQGKGTFVTERKTKIRFLSWYGESSQGKPILDKLIKIVNASLPAIHVEVIPTTFFNLKKDLLNLISSGSAPDVVQLTNVWTSYFSSMGALARLDELFHEKYLVSNNLTAKGAGKEALYSVPLGLSPIVHMANNSVLEKAGILELPEKMTLDKFSAICKEIESVMTQKNHYSYGLSWFSGDVDFMGIYTFLAAFGGGFYMKNNGVLINTPENIRAFEWLREFVNTHKIITADIFTIRKLFAGGKIGIISDGPWFKYLMREHVEGNFEKHFTLMHNPSGSGKSYTWEYNHSLAVCSQSQNKQAAAEFIELITGNNMVSAGFFNETGMVPVNIEQQETPLFQTKIFTELKGHLSKSGILNAQNPMFEKAMQFCKDAVNRILFKNADIKKELEEKEYYLKMLYDGK